MLYRTKYPGRMFKALAQMNVKKESTDVGSLGFLPGLHFFDSETLNLQENGFKIAVHRRDKSGSAVYCVFEADDAMLLRTIGGLSDVGRALSKLDPESEISVQVSVSRAIEIYAKKSAVSVSTGFMKSSSLAVDEYSVRFDGTLMVGSLDNLTPSSVEGVSYIEFTTDAGPPVEVFEAIRAEWARTCEQGLARVRRYFGANPPL